MARAIIGGLAFSTVVSLLVVPAFYAYFDTLAAWGRKVMSTARSLAGPAAVEASA
jgi:HAE1 family hydrophobic/amphiphilic exporter-1